MSVVHAIAALLASAAAPPGTQPTIRDVTFDNSPTTGTGDDVYDVAFPTGVAAGDRVIIGLLTSKETAQGAITSTITAPVITNAGTITQFTSTTSANAGRDVRLVLWEVTWNGTETGTITVESATTTGESSTAFAIAIDDVRAGGEWLENTPTPTTGADDPVTAPTPLTASNDNRFVVLITGYGDDGGAFASFTGGEGADIPLVEEDSSVAGADRRVAVHAVGLNTGSITGKSEATARTADSWICVGLIIRPTGS